MIRSLLYVPAHSERFIAKAHERGADAIILDLEDAVPVAAKTTARRALATAVPAVGRGGARVFVRINADRELITADAEAACRAGAYGLYVPKVQSVAVLEQLVAVVAPIEAELSRVEMVFVAIVEDPGAVLDAREIAQGPRLLGLSLGGEDLALSLGASPTPDVLRVPKLLVHYAAKAAGLKSFGLLRSIADYSDLDGIAAAAREAKEHGFDGAGCVHPAAVPLLNAGFSASAEDRAWAARVLEAATHHPGAFALDGRMIDAPVVARARAVMASGE